MDKIAVFLLVALNILQEHRFMCDGMVVSSSTTTTGSGGSLDGDPAPGRSPGPPQYVSPHYHRNPDDQPTLISTSDIINDFDCNLDGDITDIDRTSDFNVTLDHQFFRTDVLVPGIIYQGMHFNFVFKILNFYNR